MDAKILDEEAKKPQSANGRTWSSRTARWRTI